MIEMEKNGLFLCSIGLLVILYSMNPNRGHTDIYSLTTGVALVALGIFVFRKGKAKSQNGGK